jgi:hypothetical protein
MDPRRAALHFSAPITRERCVESLHAPRPAHSQGHAVTGGLYLGPPAARELSSKRVRDSAFFALGLVVGLGFASREASAFCRSTTCSGDCPTDDNGCPSTGQPLFWPTSCVGFSLQKNGTQSLDFADVRLAIQQSFQAWSEVPCPDKSGSAATMTFSELDDVSCRTSEYNAKGQNVNVILFKDDDWTYHGIDGTLAKTSVTYDVHTGEIFDADIEVNAAENNLTVSDTQVGYDLRAIVTHEAGHFIGVAHSPDPDATMFATYTPGSISQRKLSADDLAAVCAIYPPDRIGACDPTPRGGFSGTCDHATTTGCAIASEGARGDVAGLGAIAFIGAIACFRRRRVRHLSSHSAAA